VTVSYDFRNTSERRHVTRPRTTAPHTSNAGKTERNTRTETRGMPVEREGFASAFLSTLELF
jgi:hypothetical protein